MHDMARRCRGEGDGATIELTSPAMVATATVVHAREQERRGRGRACEGEWKARGALAAIPRTRGRASREGARGSNGGARSRMAATKAFPQTPGGRGRARLRIQILAYSVEIRILSAVAKLLLS
jgi:hypothetical protein